MADAEEKKLQAKYRKEWLELKHLLIAKHFSGQECKQEHTVDGATIKEYDEPPLKKFVTAPRLKEDLAKYLDTDT